MTSADPIFINLSPREELCAVCHCPIFDGRKGIAMFEGEPVPHDHAGDWGGFPCCDRCFVEFERVQSDEGQRRVWFAGKRRELRIAMQQDFPAYVGDLA